MLFLKQYFIHFLFYFMNIYVGNLSYKVRENDLQGVMEEYGKVDSCKIIKDAKPENQKDLHLLKWLMIQLQQK